MNYTMAATKILKKSQEERQEVPMNNHPLIQCQDRIASEYADLEAICRRPYNGELSEEYQKALSGCLESVAHVPMLFPSGPRNY